MDQLDQLRLFLAIVDSGSFASGGRQLGRSPSSATRIVAEMERRLGVRLLQRSTRKLALTDAGARLVEQAQRLVTDFDETIDYVTGENAALRGRLRLSAPLFFGRRHFAPIVSAFLDLHPEITAQLSLEDHLVDMIEERVDVALRIGRMDNSSLVGKRVGQVSRIVVASPGYLKKHGMPRKPEDLERHQAILFVNNASAPAWLFKRAEKGEQAIKMRGRLQVDRAEVAIALAAEGKGLARILSYQVVPELRAGRLVRLLRKHELPPLPVQLIYPSARQLAPRVRAFLDYAAAGIAKLDLNGP